MAIYVINLSVDPPDAYVSSTASAGQREDLRVNEMESIGEWVLEYILDFPDAVPEHDEPDEADKVTKGFFHWMLVAPKVNWLLPVTLPVFKTSSSFPQYPHRAIRAGFPQRLSPPPWVG